MNIHGKSRGKKLFGCAAAIALASAIGMTAFVPPPLGKCEGAEL